MSPPPDKALAAALGYIAKGFRVVPIPHRQKGPVIKEWQSLVIRAEDAPAHFRGTCNIGVILGHGGATDVDLDCAEAIAAAGYLLPRTATFGHASRPFSHFIYVCHGLAASEEHAARKWTSTDGGGLLELRSGGGGAAAQTVFPPSIHPSGEPIAWDDGEDIRQVDPHDLVTACNRLAACALLARLYPKEGARHDAALVLGGFLAGCEIGVPYIKLMLEAIGAASGQPREKIRDMIRSAADGAGLQRPAGLPKMVEAFGKEVTAKCAGWLGYVARGEDKPYKAEAAMPNGEWPGPNGWAMALIRAADVEPKPVSWLWRGWLARGKMHLIAGQPGAGKTTIALKAAATVSSGCQWPDGSLAEQGNVVIWSGEDDLADTLIPRLEASGADLTRVFFAGEMSYGKERRAFDPAKDIPALQAAIDKAGGASLIVVDPIVSATAADSHKNSETRRGLQPLVDMATTINAALIGVTHF